MAFALVAEPALQLFSPGDVPTLRPAHADPACASKLETSTLRSESYRRVEDLDLDISRDVTEQSSGELRRE